MNFLIADTFTTALARLTGDEQKVVETTAFDLQMNIAAPGLSFHKLDRAKDKHFWSVRASGDLRLSVHRTDESLLLCYVDHHDKAYAWAERRKLVTHPVTGAAQLVELRESVVQVLTRMVAEQQLAYPAAITSRRVFEHVSSTQLLEYGVPEEWLSDALAATEDSIFDLAEHLPGETADALLELAVGRTPALRKVAERSFDPFTHPDAQRRFRVMSNVEELERALAFPWEKWSVFLHPSQRDLVERQFNGPARVAGSAGTGKTVVAQHRAAHLARTIPNARVLVTTFSITLARMLRQKLHRLVGDDSASAAHITVDAIDEIGITLYERAFGTPKVAQRGMIRSALADASQAFGPHNFSDRFLEHEWSDVVDACQLRSWEAHRDVARLGRRNRLCEKQRAQLWPIFAKRQQLLHDGALGQRIFQTPFSWKSLGVDIRGRSTTLRVNYRTSHQIRRQADRLLGTEIADVDAVVETCGGTVSVFNGADPVIRIVADEAAEADTIGAWIRERMAQGVLPQEIGVFVRSAAEIARAQAGVAAADLLTTTPAPGVDAEPGKVVLMPMHLAKGLERQLLYVACTRARDQLLVTAISPGSEFLVDLAGGDLRASKLM